MDQQVSSALLIIQSTFQPQQKQRNRGKLHKHNTCISLHLNQTKDDRNVTENSFKIDYHHTSLSQEMHLISKPENVQNRTQRHIIHA